MSRFTSVAFLVPIKNKYGNNREFIKNFIDLGYDALFISDYYGLRGRSDEHVINWLNDLFKMAEKFEASYQIKPKFILDVEGFRLNSNKTLRDMADRSPYVVAYHVIDEPDSHNNGTPDRPDVTPEDVDELLTGSLNRLYTKPLMITFENQAGIPNNRNGS